MTHRRMMIVTGVSTLLLAFLALQYLPAHANDNAMTVNLDPPTNKIFLPLVFKNYTPPAPLWRFGAATGRRALTSYDSYGLTSMRFGWFVDFVTSANPPRPYGMEYVPTVRVKQDKVAVDGFTITDCRVGPYYATPPSYSVSPSVSQIQAIAIAHPGMTWLIGNEMERIDWGNGYCARQDEMLPELYAQAYHDLYSAIKIADPTAQVAIGGMVEFTPLRSKYLDRVWAEYSRLAILNGWTETTMPVDVWNIHLYLLQEVQNSWGADIPAGLSETSGTIYSIDDNKDFTKARDQIVALRAWMKEHQQDKPLIITEYGVNMPSHYSGFSALEVRDSMMYPSFDYFLNATDPTTGYSHDGYRLVQRWNWWSVDYDDGKCNGASYEEYFGGSLFNSGLPLSDPNCLPPPQGITSLGTYWKDYVKNLPIGSAKPYAP